VGLAQDDTDRARDLAQELGDDGLVADVDRHQAFLSLQQGRPGEALRTATASLVRYRSLGRRWPTAASLLLAAFGSMMLGDTATARREAAEAVGILTPLGDSWGLVHAHAMLGGIAQAEHRFDDAARALERAAEESTAMGFLGQAALHRATLARIQQRAGDPRAAASYARAIDEAVTNGDGRLAATARLNLARLLRLANDQAGAIALLAENEHWYAAAGGGDFALLSHGLLAAMNDDAVGLEAVRQEALATGNVEVQVQALDAMARLAASRGDLEDARTLLAAADTLAPQVAHLLDEADRIDADQARRSVTAATGTESSSRP
jgi:hypothetical protein